MKILSPAVALFLLLVSPVASAQDQPSLLYEVSGNDLAAPSYLFGTIHLMCPDDIQMTDAIQEKLSNSEQVALELDLDEPNAMQEMQQMMMMPDGRTLKDIMSEEDYATVRQFLQDSLMTPIAAVERFGPIALYGMLAMQMMHCQPGSYELSLIQLAQAEEKEVVGLETFEEQLAAFNQVSEEEQIDYFTETIEEYDEAKGEFQQLLDAYRAQDVDRLYELSLKTMDEVEGMEQHLLIDRNQAWIPRMESLMKQSTFFAVGAGHLGGEYGLLELLEKQGYTVTPVAN